jgi:hypothetical protein
MASDGANRQSCRGKERNRGPRKSPRKGPIGLSDLKKSLLFGTLCLKQSKGFSPFIWARVWISKPADSIAGPSPNLLSTHLSSPN